MFNLIQLGWADGGPLIDFCSFGNMDGCHSFLCSHISFTSPNIFLEFCGFVLIDTFSNDEDQE